MAADGSNPRNLTNAPEADGEGQFLPDGSKIIYVRNTDLFSMNADGTAQQQITFSGEAIDGSVAISPDGARIAWQRTLNIDGQIADDVFVANVDGSAAIRLTPEGSRSPVWRPCPK
jgi:Tol biopolymer transport system component